jgi:hypothetical protein
LLPGDFLQVGPYLIPIQAVLVGSGTLQIFIGGLFSQVLGLEELLDGTDVYFSGLTNATWLNDWTLQVASVSYDGLYSDIIITMATVPSGMPYSYARTSDTGNFAAGPARLYQYVDDYPLTSDGSGNATFDIFPCVREALPAGVAISLSSPQGTFRLADNRRTAAADQKKTIALKLKCREAI